MNATYPALLFVGVLRYFFCWHWFSDVVSGVTITASVTSMMKTTADEEMCHGVLLLLAFDREVPFSSQHARYPVLFSVVCHEG